MSEAMRQDNDGIKATLTNHTMTLHTVVQDIDGIKVTLAGHTDRLGSVEHILRKVVVEQAHARGDIEWLKENTVTRTEYRAGMDQILGKLDGIAGKIEDSRYGSAKNLDRLDEHERRIRALETKPS